MLFSKQLRQLTLASLVAAPLLCVAQDLELGVQAPSRARDDSALVRAATVGDIAEVERLFVEHDPYERYRATFMAGWSGHLEVVKRLLDMGVSAQPPEIGMDALLRMAATGRRIDEIELLCEYGADPNWPDPAGDTALQRGLWYISGDAADTRAAWKLIECGARPIGDRLPSAWSPPEDPNSMRVPVVHDAVATGDVALVRRIVELGADVDARGGAHRRTALFQPTLSLDMARALLELGADPAAVDEEGTAALAYVACRPARDTSAVVAALLAAGAPIDGVDVETGGATALSCAAMHAAVDLVRLLIEQGADVNHLNGDGRSILGLIVEVARDPNHNAHDVVAATFPPALHPTMASARRNEIVEILLAAGARADGDPLVIKAAEDGWRALALALQGVFRERARQCIADMPDFAIPNVRPSDSPRAGRIGAAQVSVIEGAPDPADGLTVSPDGRWLAYAVANAVGVYDLVQDRLHEPISVTDRYFDASAILWRVDSLGLKVGSATFIEFSPQGIVTYDGAGFLPAAKSGEDLCAARADPEGYLTGKPGPSESGREWSPLAPISYELRAVSSTRDALVAVEETRSEALVEHVRPWPIWLVSALPNTGRDFSQFLTAQALSPDGQYLYYEVSGRSPIWMARAEPLHFVADVVSRPVKVWQIETSVSAAYWLPNGHELLLRIADSGRAEVGAPRLAVVSLPAITDRSVPIR